MREKRLLRESVAKYWRILPVFLGNGLGELLVHRQLLVSGQNICKSSREKVVLMHGIGWLFVGKGFFRKPEERLITSPTVKRGLYDSESETDL
jgi:hypothetical protein